jgi:DNA-binding transcriptional ArsR family regulator
MLASRMFFALNYTGCRCLKQSKGQPVEPAGKVDDCRTAEYCRLTYSYMGMYCSFMARAATTSDAFNAVAEPRRRQILIYLASDERQVGEIVSALGLDQPSVSKHLGVLREVGLVRVRRNGRHRMYRTNAEAIRPLHEWTKTFERYWSHQLGRVKERAERAAAQIDRAHHSNENS